MKIGRHLPLLLFLAFLLRSLKILRDVFVCAARRLQRWFRVAGKHDAESGKRRCLYQDCCFFSTFICCLPAALAVICVGAECCSAPVLIMCTVKCARQGRKGELCG